MRTVNTVSSDGYPNCCALFSSVDSVLSDCVATHEFTSGDTSKLGMAASYNIILVNGFAEEIMMRGFVFRHLRTGRPFWRAAALSTTYFAAYHSPLILTQGVVVGSIAVVIAIQIGFLTG
jgi:membrane protease YdiL (CAAX protease family)